MGRDGEALRSYKFVVLACGLECEFIRYVYVCRDHRTWTHVHQAVLPIDRAREAVCH